jgi:hypothetical protein
MARALENPDRNFSANGDAEENFEALGATLDFSKPALVSLRCRLTRLLKSASAK